MRMVGIALQDSILVGYGAAATEIRDENSFYSVKRLLGRSYNDVARDAEDLTYSVTHHDSYEESSDGPSDSFDSNAQRPGNASLAVAIANGSSSASVSVHVPVVDHSEQYSGTIASEQRIDALRLKCPIRRTLLTPEQVTAELLQELLLRAALKTGTDGIVDNAVRLFPQLICGV